MSTLARITRSSLVEIAQGFLLEKLWPTQLQTLQIVEAKDLILQSCHSSGKSRSLAALALAFCLKYPGARVLVVSSGERALQHQFFNELEVVFGRIRHYLPDAKMLRLELRLGSGFGDIIGISSDNPVRFQGYHAPAGLLVIVDEASHLEQPVFEALESTLASGGVTRFVLAGNPTRTSGVFFSLARKPGDWALQQIDAWATPNMIAAGIKSSADLSRSTAKDKYPGALSIPFLKSRLKRYGADSIWWKIRALGQFADNVSGQLFGIDDIFYSFENQLDYGNGAEVVVGVDPSGAGADAYCALGQRGDLVEYCFRKEGRLDTVRTTDELIVELETAYPTSLKTLVIETDGLGGVAFNYAAKELAERPLWAVEGLSSAGKPNSGDHQNARSERYSLLAERFRDRTIAVRLPFEQREDLANELLAIRQATSRASGRLIIEAKDQIKTRLGHSPDYADALSLLGGYDYNRDRGELLDEPRPRFTGMVPEISAMLREELERDDSGLDFTM